MRPFPDVTECDILPLERSETIPSSWYTDPMMTQIDRECLFSSTWQYVGPSSGAPNQGDYFCASVANNPIIVVRGKDEILRGFYNVCRHRGGPLAIDERGTCNALQCKYHGWTYTLDGMLRGIPQFDRVELFDRKDYGLVPVKLDTWEGLLFVNLDQGERLVPLSSALHGIAGRIAPISLAARKFYRRVNYELNCHWKVYVDNYLEGYHLPYVHPELCNLLDFQKYTTETFDRYSLQYSPLNSEDTVYGSGGGEAFYYFIFPNFMLNILPGRLQTNIVIPLAHNRTKVVFDYYYDDVISPESISRIENDIGYSERVQREDIEICEHVQKGLESAAYNKGRFSVEMERGVYHFQSLLKKAYRSFLNR